MFESNKSPLLAALLVLTPLAGAQIRPTRIEPVQSQVGEQLANMAELVRRGQVTARDIGRLGALIGQWSDAVGPTFPSACELDRRLQAIVQGLTERATITVLRMEHLSRVQELWVDSLIDRKMFQLRQAARKGRLDRKAYYAIVRLLHRRAELATDDPSAQAIRDRLVAAVGDVMGSVRTAVSELHEARLMLIRERITRAAKVVGKYAAKLELTRSDRQRLLDLYADRARAAAGKSFFPTCH